MKITLLSSQKELSRKDNTGILCEQISEITLERIVWRRTKPDPGLLKVLSQQQAVLLSPKGNGEPVEDIDNTQHFVLLDATWQEARKMYNRSDYLKTAAFYTFDNPPPSRYNLRRNQVDGGLCTCECVIELMKIKGMTKGARQLEQLFNQMLASN